MPLTPWTCSRPSASSPSTMMLLCVRPENRGRDYVLAFARGVCAGLDLRLPARRVAVRRRGSDLVAVIALRRWRQRLARQTLRDLLDRHLCGRRSGDRQHQAVGPLVELKKSRKAQHARSRRTSSRTSAAAPALVGEVSCRPSAAALRSARWVRSRMRASRFGIPLSETCRQSASVT